MTRYFVNYIDDEEVRELRKTQHERPIGEYEDGEKIMSHLGTVVQQYVGLASAPDQDVIDNPPEVIGISKTEQPGHGTIWWMTRPLILSWIKPRKELDFEVPGCTREYVGGEEERSGWMSFYAQSPCYAIANLKLNDGRTLNEVPDEELQTLFAEVDFENFKFDPQGAIGSLEKSLEFHGEHKEEVSYEDLCLCINCEYLIHVDDSSDGVCGECGCFNPEHPAYDDVHHHMEYTFFDEFN